MGTIMGTTTGTSSSSVITVGISMTTTEVVVIGEGVEEGVVVTEIEEMSEKESGGTRIETEVGVADIKDINEIMFELYQPGM